MYVYPDGQAEEMLNVVNDTSVYGLTGAVFASDRYIIMYTLYCTSYMHVQRLKEKGKREWEGGRGEGRREGEGEGRERGGGGRGNGRRRVKGRRIEGREDKSTMCMCIQCYVYMYILAQGQQRRVNEKKNESCLWLLFTAGTSFRRLCQC